MLSKKLIIAFLLVNILFGSLDAKQVEKKRPKRQILSCLGCVSVSLLKNNLRLTNFSNF